MNEEERKATELEQADEAERQKQRQIAERRRVIRLLAGGYLVYLAYQLISDALGKSGWPAEKIICLIVGAAFGVIGAAFLILNLKAQTSRTNEPEKPDESEKGESEQ